MKEIRRRGFLKVSSVLLLAGCAKVTQTTNDSQSVQRFFSWFAKLNDRLGQLVFGKNRLAPEFTEADITRPDFKNNYHGITPRMPPDSWFMRLSGEVDNPKPFRLEDFKQMPSRTQITELICVEGWSAIAKWKGVPLSHFLDLVGVRPEAKYVAFIAADDYWDSLDLQSARHPQTLLVYELNDRPLSPEHGGPLRLVCPTHIGYKNVKGLIGLAFLEEHPSSYWAAQGYPWHYGL
jgi:DMSO/TMAO reductase YedYZ molybdopterin-dependent catalytic subunit